MSDTNEPIAVAAISTHNLAFAHLTYPDLAFAARTLTLIEGPSGCGKSTLLKLINRTVASCKGRIKLFGVDTATMDPLALRRRAQLVGQDVFLFDGSVKSNFEAFYEARGQKCPDAARMRVFLSLTQSHAKLDDTVETMSGGEKQRVYLAVMMSFEPDVLLLDEPASALDSVTSHALFKALRGWAQHVGMTVIAVSHDPTLPEFLGCPTVRLNAPQTAAKNSENKKAL